nr:hypothetical protein [Clostridium sp. Cult2]
MGRIEERFLKDYNPDNVAPFNWRRILILLVFLAAFPVMIWGVSVGGWWFAEMSALFFGVALVIIFLSGLSEKEAVQMVLFSILGFFITSSSGLATLSMPIMAPLADKVRLSRDIVVTAYNWGQGWMAFITPTGLILATLEMVDVTYDKWLKFILPLMGIVGGFSILMLILQTII